MKVESFVLWAPGVETHEDWQEWLNGNKKIENSIKSPVLAFASPIATRRLSQLTKMVCYAAGTLGLDADELFMTSVYGESNAQFKLNISHIQENEVKPAAFSLSVFNAAAAEATILLKSQIPYSVFFSGKDNAIPNLLKAGSAPIISGRIKSAILIYAEEALPDEYKDNAPWQTEPMVIGLKLSSNVGTIPENIEGPASLIGYLIENCSEAWL